MDNEPDPEHPKDKLPLWYKAENGLGTIRVTALAIQGTSDRPYDPVQEARTHFERLSKNAGVSNPQITTQTIGTLVRWKETGEERGITVMTDSWSTYDQKGAIILSFSYDAKLVGSDVLNKEIAQVQEIVERIIHL